jgi:hypothetical protein
MDGSVNDPVDRNAYAVFISQLELHSIWVESANVANFHGPTLPDGLSIIVDGGNRWESLPDGFRAFQHYRIRLNNQEEKLLAEIQVTFGADYESELPMSDELFATFGDVNLPLNTWPYLREYAASTVGRLGWLPITLPTLKAGTNAVQPTATPAAPPPKPKRKRASSKPPAAPE